MSWSEGSAIMSMFISSMIRNGIKDDARYEIYKDLIPYFEAGDCDTLYECADEDDMFHKALYELDEYYRADFDGLSEPEIDEEIGYDDDEAEE